jgi:putative nucleotidyltransferase with HDIG domain
MKKIKILLVEDERVTHKVICKYFAEYGYEWDGVYSFKDAAQKIKEKTYDIIFTNIQLPDGSGMELLELMKQYMMHTPVVILTASGKETLIQDALNRGAADFITKPFHRENLPTIIHKNLEKSKIETSKNSVPKVSILSKAIHSLVAALEAKDSYTSGHSMRVAQYAATMGNMLGLSKNDKFILELSAVLHDIGKIGVPDHILKKAASLQDIEYNIAKEHPITGSNIVKKIDELHEVAAIIRHHHEKYDGTGYPDGLKGEAIPLASRILTIVDAYESLVSDRAYRKHKSPDEALTEIIKYAGSQFDPNLVMIFADIIKSGEVFPSPTLLIEEET